MEDKYQKLAILDKVVDNLSVCERLDIIRPRVFPDALTDLMDLMKDTNKLTGQYSPGEQFVQDQVHLIVDNCARLVRKKDITLEMLHASLENLGKLFERMLVEDHDAAKRLVFCFDNLVFALAPLLSYLEQTLRKERIDWDGLVKRMKEAVRKQGEMQEQKQVHAKLADFRIEKTLCVRKNSILRKGSFGNIDCVLRFSPFRAENARSRSFVAEIEAASMVSSIFIPKVYACFNTKSDHVYCAEYVRGVSSDRVLLQSTYFEDRILRVVLGQVGLALDYLHATGTIHRDLNMPNILMMRGCRVKLIGLQHCKVCIGSFSKNFTFDKSVEFEQGNEHLGRDRYYMAPELLAEKAYGPGVDWWSLGITCFNLASGRRPFGHLAENELAARAASSEIAWPTFRDPSWQLRDFVTKCLQPHETRMNMNTFMKHPFFEGIDWNRLQQHELWEDFPSLDRVLYRSEDGAIISQPTSISAERDTCGRWSHLQ